MSSLMFKRIVAAAAFIGIAVAGAQTAIAAEQNLTATNAWVRMAPPTLKTHGGYLTIANKGSEPDELISASSENYKLVEVHISRVEDGIAVMEQLMSVEIPAGGQTEFKPGGLHLMLVGAKTPLERGATIPIKLGFRSGAEISVEAKVMSGAPQAAGETKDGDHSGHKTH